MGFSAQEPEETTEVSCAVHSKRPVGRHHSPQSLTLRRDVTHHGNFSMEHQSARLNSETPKPPKDPSEGSLCRPASKDPLKRFPKRTLAKDPQQDPPKGKEEGYYLEKCILDPFWALFWSRNGPLLSLSRSFEAGQSGSPQAQYQLKTTCLSILNGLGTTLET